jgi:micrococcal nuclease
MKLFFFGLVLCFAHLHSTAKTVVGIVTYVGDGDTVWVQVERNAKPIQLRLTGLDAPEICQAWGPQARDALKAKLFKQTVSITTNARDEYARAIGSIELKGEDVGAWLVKNGHAWSYAYKRRPAPYANELAAAQNARRGLWAQAGAQEPRVFRKSHGRCTQGKRGEQGN